MKFCALAETLRMSLRELQIRMRLLLHYDFVNEQVAVSACPGVPQGNGPRVFCDYPQERSVCFWKMESVVNEEGERIVDGGKFRVSIGLGQPDERTRELTGKDCIVFTVDRK